MARTHWTVTLKDRAEQIRELVRLAKERDCRVDWFPAEGRPPGTITIVIRGHRDDVDLVRTAVTLIRD